MTTKMTILRRLQRAIENHPIVMNSSICLGLWVAGDGLAQASEIYKNKRDVAAIVNSDENKIYAGKRKDCNNTIDDEDVDDNESLFSYYTARYDLMRTVKCASYGALVSGPVLALWYPYLDRLFTTTYRLKRNGWTQAVAKVATDELIMEPPSLLIFYGYMNIFEGGTMASFLQKLNQEFFNSWITSMTYWPPVSLLSFRFLPVYWQAPIINMCCIIWDGYLSHRNTVAQSNHHASIQPHSEKTDGTTENRRASLLPEN